MTKRLLSLAGTAFLMAILASSAALSQSVRLLGDFRDWSAYAASDAGGEVCFALSKPKDVTPIPDGYSQAYLYLSDRPREGVSHELNLVAGFVFAPDTPATVSVDGTSFALFTENDAAWLDNTAQAQNLAGVIRAGSTLVIEGTSEKGIKIKQTYSLLGATAASRAIDSGC